MSGVWKWSSVIVLAALAAGILRYLIPTDSTEKATRLVIGAFIICSILLSVGRLVQQFDVQAFAQGEGAVAPNQQYQDTMNRRTAEVAQAAVRTMIIAALSEKGTQCKNATLNMDTNEDGRISIIKAFVNLDQRGSGKLQETKKLFEQELGLTMEVMADGGS